MGDERLGRYTVLKHLASGGMADVLLGRTDGIEGFERHVVLKRIRAEHAKDQRFMQMFVDEARLAATLHHQNIVQVHDIGETSGEYFFAMEYLHGEDLRQLLSAVSKSRTHMPLGYVVAIVGSVAAGLHYAHERKDSKGKPLNIVHRDVSPSNVLIGYDGSVKVVDFGIAKAARRQQETRSGSLKGKVSYMSPEQCKGDEVDRRSDVWALGVLLYELATTTRLFKGDNDYLQMDAIVNGKVPAPRVRRPDLPNEMAAIIMRALSVDPARRYQSADELRVALDHYAVRAGLTASTSALASYMNEMFGQRPEPWLVESDGTPPAATDEGSAIDVDCPTQASVKHSWTEIPRDQIDAEASSDPAKTRAGRRNSANAIAVADTIAPPMKVAPITPRETRTSMNMGFEAQAPVAAHAPSPATARRKQLAWIGAPMLGVAAIAIWQLALETPQAVTPSAARQPAPASPAPAPIATPAPAPGRDIPTVRVAGFVQPPDAMPAVQPDPRPPAPARHVAAAPPNKSASKPAAKPATPPKVATSAPAAPASQPLPPAPAPVAQPPVAPARPPVAPPPPVIEPQLAVLSNAAVSAVASNHAGQLAKCEGTDELRGEVSVTFQIDANGRVVRHQLTSTIKSARVAGCILKAVQSWRFPKPPTGSAKGVYSINYQ